MINRNEPRDLLLGPDNDLVVTTDLQFSRGLAAVAQSCRIALQMFAGEWFLDLDAGVPFWDSILGQKPDVAIQAARIAFRSELLAVDGVVDVAKMNVEFNATTRTMSVTFAVTTDVGETPAETLTIGAGA